MAVPDRGGAADTTERRRTGWWGWRRDYGWDDQGCLGCGLAWWIIALCAFLVFGYWGWGVPGSGGWGGWGWRHNANYNCQCPGQTGPGQGGNTNMQPGSGGTNEGTSPTTR